MIKFYMIHLKLHTHTHTQHFLPYIWTIISYACLIIILTCLVQKFICMAFVCFDKILCSTHSWLKYIILSCVYLHYCCNCMTTTMRSFNYYYFIILPSSCSSYFISFYHLWVDWCISFKKFIFHKFSLSMQKIHATNKVKYGFNFERRAIYVK